MPYRVLGKMMEHVRLVSRMARTTGADLVGAVDSGDLDQEDWAGMVENCRRCGWAGQCPEWLDAHDIVECPPETCPNRAKFEALKASAARRVEERA